MRFYDLILSDTASGQIWQPSRTGDTLVKGKRGSTFTSYVNGQTDPGALNIEIDLPVVPFNQPQGSGFVRIWGVGLPMIGQAADLNGARVRLSAGMKKGLPLANPAQAGLILDGTVFQAFGNWQGTNQTLDLICYPPAAQDDQDIAWDWPKGTTLASALTTCFQQAFSKYNFSPNVDIASLIQSSDDKGHYTRLSQLADHVQQVSEKLGAQQYGKSYSGALIKIVGNTIYAYDSQTIQSPIQIEFTDLIGQPTWIDAATISFKTVLRSDIAVGSQVKFPTKGLLSPYVLTTANAAFPNAPSRSKSSFQGTFIVTEAHHFGNFRQPDADSWVTAYNAVPKPQ